VCGRGQRALRRLVATRPRQRFTFTNRAEAPSNHGPAPPAPKKRSKRRRAAPRKYCAGAGRGWTERPPPGFHPPTVGSPAISPVERASAETFEAALGNEARAHKPFRSRPRLRAACSPRGRLNELEPGLRFARPCHYSKVRESPSKPGDPLRLRRPRRFLSKIAPGRARRAASRRPARPPLAASRKAPALHRRARRPVHFAPEP